MMTGNIMDYLEWYGDFDFSVLPFNEVDNLILAELSYASLDRIVPEPQLGRKTTGVPVKEAAQRLMASGRVEKSCKLEQNAGFILYQMAKGKRFSDAVLGAYNFPAQLSGGEQQRDAIARALAKNPKLLLCDEPTGALDYATGKQVLKLLQDTCRNEGKTVVVITHNSALTAMADRVITVKNGTVTSMVKNEHIVPVEEIEW